MVELILIIVGIFLIQENEKLKELMFTFTNIKGLNDDWEDHVVAVSLGIYLLYAVIHFAFYLLKLFMFLGVYAYFWYYGGLDDPNDPYSDLSDSYAFNKTLNKQNTDMMIHSLRAKVNSSVKSSGSFIKDYDDNDIYNYEVIDEDHLDEILADTMDKTNKELECPICLIPHELGSEV